MNQKYIRRLLSLPMVMLLTSGTTKNFVTPFSYIKHANITCKEQLIGYSSRSISTLSNVKNDTVATLTFNYEVYEMNKPTELLTTYHPSYVLLYQADIYVNNKVKYKGGMFNWFDGEHAGFLKNISISATFSGTKNQTHHYCTPSIDSSSGNYSLRIMRGVYPEDDLYTQNSKSANKQTDDNNVTDGLANSNLDTFTDTVGIMSNSYYYNLSYMNTHITEFLNKYDSRILAMVSSSENVESDKITFNQKFEYNQKLAVSPSEYGTGYTYKVTHDEKGIYSGPAKYEDSKDIDDSKPFNFTFYGTFGVECPQKPSSILIELGLDTYHGSHVNLDTFESTASDSFTISL